MAISKNPCTVKSSRAFTQPTYMHAWLIALACAYPYALVGPPSLHCVVVDQPRCLLPLKKIIERMKKILALSPDTCNILSINIFWAS